MSKVEKSGFELIREKRLDELEAMLYEYTHIKSGASLVYLDRDDENKTFAIGFPTPPTDDTGVFHIIEHSVLCGSKKYPLNDPFAELLKGSLNTFLNALTYEDRTIYPVSSRCERDFLNLADVYLDAVFSPNLLDNPSIFKQEGWHYEYDEVANALTLNGVVYNEMKGAYSSPDELGGVALNRALFSGTPYCRDSGGDPLHIPELTYEAFKAAHQKHYHPSGARIILDGRMDIDRVLSLIDSHLSKYERREPISLSVKKESSITPLTRISYEISENEDEHGKARLLYGFIYSDYSDREAHLTLSVLADILCGSNASPLKKALLDRGLAQDAAMYSIKSREHTAVIEIRDADEKRLDEIDELISEVIRSLAEGGIDKQMIASTLNSMEFRLRERDFGTLPTGIAFAMSIYGSWMYGGLPEDALLLNHTIESIRGKVESGYFEDMLLKITLDNPRRAKVIMLPDKTLGERNALEERERLEKLLSEMSDEDIQKIKDEEAALRLWQNTEPTEEAISSLPTLSISDIPKGSSRPVASHSEIEGVKIVRCPTKTNGIVYISLLFDASDVAKEELLSLSMLSSALLNFPTESYDALSLQNEIKANLGSLFSSFTVGTRDNVATPYLKIGASALTSRTEDLIRLVGEILTSKIDGTEEIKNIALQAKSHIEDMMTSAGLEIALSRVEASISESGAISEYLSGYEAYRLLCEICSDEGKIAELTSSIAALLKKLTDRRRLTMVVTGDADDELLSRIINIFPVGNGITKAVPTPICADKSEFVLVPSKVAYAVAGGKSSGAGKKLGLMRVVRSMLSYEYLWNTVRVQGGAYGTGFIPRKDGSISFYSYRDPSPARSLMAYKQSSDYLRAVAEESTDITKFIIGAIGEYDTIITPKTASLITTADYLNGWTAEDEAEVRRQMLNVKSGDLIEAADIIDSVLREESIAIVGGSEHLASLDIEPKRIIKI